MVVWSVLNVLKIIFFSHLVAVCFICYMKQLISHPVCLSWIMSSYHMVCLLSLSWRPRSPHLVVWSVVWEEEANVAASHCVSAAHSTVHFPLCVSTAAAPPERCCTLAVGQPCCTTLWPEGTMLHHLVPSSTPTMLLDELSMHCFLHIHADAVQCSGSAAMQKSFGHNSESG